VDEGATFKIVLKIERRKDGGLRVWSDDVPGLVLSHRDPAKVLADIQPALKVILKETFGCEVEVSPLTRMPPARVVRQREAVAQPHAPAPVLLGRRKTLEYAALAC
jgi:hypothetical protein